MEEACGALPRLSESGSPTRSMLASGHFSTPLLLAPVILQGARVWPWLCPHFLVLPQGQSEETYSTVKTGAPAVTVTNLKPATRYVFQIRAASPGPSWETQSFNPSIEVQTPGEGK